MNILIDKKADHMINYQAINNIFYILLTMMKNDEILFNTESRWLL